MVKLLTISDVMRDVVVAVEQTKKEKTMRSKLWHPETR
jgi:hypothetical protein